MPRRRKNAKVEEPKIVEILDLPDPEKEEEVEEEYDINEGPEFEYEDEEEGVEEDEEIEEGVEEEGVEEGVEEEDEEEEEGVEEEDEIEEDEEIEEGVEEEDEEEEEGVEEEDEEEEEDEIEEGVEEGEEGVEEEGVEEGVEEGEEGVEEGVEEGEEGFEEEKEKHPLFRSKIIRNILKNLNLKDQCVLSQVNNTFFKATREKEPEKIILKNGGYKYITEDGTVLKVTDDGYFSEIRLGDLEFTFGKPIQCGGITVYSEVWITESRNDIDQKREHLWKFANTPLESLRQTTDERLKNLLYRAERDIGKNYPWYVRNIPNTMEAMLELHQEIVNLTAVLPQLQENEEEVKQNIEGNINSGE